MPTANKPTEVMCFVTPDEHTAYVSKAFDYEFTGQSTFELPKFTSYPAEKFNIGVIVGPSGSGKSLLLKYHYPPLPSPEWNHEKAIVSHFSTPEEAVKKLFAVGLSSVPSLCRPYHVLSTGEKYRADMARLLAGGMVVDEYTSVVNRETAKSLSTALAKHVRREKLFGIVLASCHYDILEWLEPDWVFDTATGAMEVNEFTTCMLMPMGHFSV